MAKNSFFPCVTLCLASGVALFFIMARGIGVSTDSIVFLNVAENILHHGEIHVTAYGLDKPMTHFPPLYPLILSGISLIFNCAVETSAKLAGAAAYALNILLSCMILRKAGLPTKTTLIATLTLALSEYMILIHAQAFTEPIFITFTLAAFVFLSNFIQNGKTRFLLSAAVCVAFACLTRYAGLALIAFATLTIFLTLKFEFRKKVSNTALFSFIALLPTLLWFARNAILVGTAADRSFTFHPLGIAHMRQLARSILFVFMPDSILNALKNANSAIPAGIAAASVLSAIALLNLRRRKEVSTKDSFEKFTT